MNTGLMLMQVDCSPHGAEHRQQGDCELHPRHPFWQLGHASDYGRQSMIGKKLLSSDPGSPLMAKQAVKSQ